MHESLSREMDLILEDRTPSRRGFLKGLLVGAGLLAAMVAPLASNAALAVDTPGVTPKKKKKKHHKKKKKSKA